jgi:hypothetical protein
LRQGVIKGVAPSTSREGWRVSKEALDDFLQQRLPDYCTTYIATNEDARHKTNDTKELNTTFNVKEVEEVEERVRADMWRELANNNIWEGYMELNKTRIHEYIQHRRYSKELVLEVASMCGKKPSIQKTHCVLFT